MGKFDDQARRRVLAWMAGHPHITLTQVGEAAGYNQPWATRWLKKEEFDAGLDALAGIARLFNQPLSALFDLRADPREDELVMRFRGATPRRQQMLLDIARDYVPDEPPLRGSAKPRARTDQ